jgi:hypothetical protein
MEISLPIAGLISVASGLLGAYGNSITRAKKDEARLTEIEVALKYTAKELGEIKILLKDKDADCYNCREEIRTSIRRVHERIDGHVKDGHKVGGYSQATLNTTKNKIK